MITFRSSLWQSTVLCWSVRSYYYKDTMRWEKDLPYPQPLLSTLSKIPLAFISFKKIWKIYYFQTYGLYSV
jgi:hypothetical protein